MNARPPAGPVHVAECPLPACTWASEPLPTVTSAVEALRRHTDGHSHADLVGYATQSAEEFVVRYDRAPRPS